MTKNSKIKDFSKLEDRTILNGTIELKSGLHIGTGKSNDVATSDMPVLRDNRGRPFIPGSSLKGVIRSNLESLLNSVSKGERDGVWVGDTFDSIGICGIKESKKILDDLKKEKNASDEDWFQQIKDYLCTVSGLFGSSHFASRVSITDSFCSSEDVVLERRDGVAIDRDLGTAKSGAKYDFEVVPVGTCFSLEVRMENLDEDEKGLVLLGFDLLDQGFCSLGGFTSRGLGRVAIQWNSYVSVSAKDILLNNDNMKEKTGEELTKLLNHLRTVRKEAIS